MLDGELCTRPSLFTVQVLHQEASKCKHSSSWLHALSTYGRFKCLKNFILVRFQTGGGGWLGLVE